MIILGILLRNVEIEAIFNIFNFFHRYFGFGENGAHMKIRKNGFILCSLLFTFSFNLTQIF